MKALSLLAALAALTFVSTSAAFARIEGPWCFHMQIGRDFVTSRCDFANYEACRAEMRGLSGTYCTQNPYYWWNRPTGPAPRKVKRRAKIHR